jgi:hypothetical protein
MAISVIEHPAVLSVPLKLDLQQKPGNTVLRFFGESSLKEAEYFERTIQRELSKPEAKAITFDLVAIHPIKNIAGRIWDWAVGYSELNRDHLEKVEFKIASEIFAKITKMDLSKYDDNPIEFDSLSVYLSQPAPEENNPPVASPAPIPDAPNIPAPFPKVLSEFLGIIRRVDQETVKVSLTSEDSEITGELSLDQFPTKTLEVGQTFRYLESISRAGLTQVEIQVFSKRKMASNEHIALYQKVKSLLPDKVF